MSDRIKKLSDETPQCAAEVFSDYAPYYDLLYRDKDYKAEAEYVANLIREFHPATRNILELGSGTGIHANLLSEMGFSVQGIERSQEMYTRSLALVDKQNSQYGRLTFTHGDIREIRLSKSFDAVIALFHVISYQTTNKDVLDTFATASHHLKPGGIFIFDIWYGPAVLTQRPEVRIKRMSDEKIEVTRLAEPVLYPNENRVDVNYHIFVRDRSTGAVKELKETHEMRYFFKQEIDIIANQSRFAILHAEEWVTRNPMSQNTWGVCFILKLA
jgi:SAM-dependent methyltransferase